MRIFLLSEWYSGQNDSEAVLMSSHPYASLEAAQDAALGNYREAMDEPDATLEWEETARYVPHGGAMGWLAGDDETSYLVREIEVG